MRTLIVAGCFACVGCPAAAGVIDAGAGVDDAGPIDAGSDDAGAPDGGFLATNLIVTVEPNLVTLQLDVPGCACERALWELDACVAYDPTAPPPSCECGGLVACRPGFTLTSAAGHLEPHRDPLFDALPLTYFHDTAGGFDPTAFDDVSLVIAGCGDTAVLALGRHVPPAVTVVPEASDAGSTAIAWTSDVPVDDLYRCRPFLAEGVQCCPEPSASPASAGRLEGPFDDGESETFAVTEGLGDTPVGPATIKTVVEVHLPP